MSAPAPGVAAATRQAELVAHPDTPAPFVSRLSATVSFVPGESLACYYVLRGDLTRVRVPAEGAGERRDGLWQHTCFEAFVRPAAGDAYVELNFAPSFDWAAYRFTGYRAGMTPVGLSYAPGLTVRRPPGSLELSAALPLADLADLRGATRVQIALAAVIEDVDGRLYYFALRHPGGKPDFHASDGYALGLPTP